MWGSEASRNERTERETRVKRDSEFAGNTAVFTSMSKRKHTVRKPMPWEIIGITRSPAHRYGVVYAADEQQALAKATEDSKSPSCMSKRNSWRDHSGKIKPCPACGDTE